MTTKQFYQIGALVILWLVIAIAGFGVFGPALISAKDTIAVLLGFVVLAGTVAILYPVSLKIYNFLKTFQGNSDVSK